MGGALLLGLGVVLVKEGGLRRRLSLSSDENAAGS